MNGHCFKEMSQKTTKLKIGDNSIASRLLLDIWATICAVFWLFWQILLRPVLKGLRKIIRNKNLWKLSFLRGSSIVFAAAMLVGLGFYYLTTLYTPPDDVDLWTINRPASLTILDKDGVEIGHRGSHYGQPVNLNDLPPYVVQAFLSTEDRRFFKHNGFDPRGFLRAMLTNLKSGSMREGASTISQQLARNLFLTNDKTVFRKVQELQLAFWLEANYNKEEILSLYLNRVYLGAGNYGIEAAALYYFSKPAKKLSLPEAALLAGLPKAPSTLSPTVNMQGAATRAQEVIDNLVETGTLSQPVAELAKASHPHLKIDTTKIEFGYFLDYIVSEAEIDLANMQGDIVIYTTIDSQLQQDAYTILTSHMTDDMKALGAEQAALIAYNSDGAIMTMIGGLSYEDSQFNRATQAKRQPGSIFKPFVYLAAIHDGMSTRSLFIDEEISIEGWTPTNYSQKYYGPVRMTDALAKSINTVAVQVTERVGRDKVIAMARQMGFTSDMEPVPSLALGAMETTLSEVTAAYLPFARNGLSVTPYAITKIENRQSELLYERIPPAQTEIFNKQVSTDMNHLLYQVMVNGTGTRANLGRRHAAGKTGTTNDWRDAWFVGYTPQITAGVWVGNDENAPMDHVTGGSLPARIWKQFMLRAHQDLPLLKLDGAYPAPSREDELRLVQFYSDLSDDFRVSASGQQDVIYNGADPYGYNETVEGRPYYEDKPEKKSEKKRPPPRRWWPFGRRH